MLILLVQDANNTTCMFSCQHPAMHSLLIQPARGTPKRVPRGGHGGRHLSRELTGEDEAGGTPTTTSAADGDDEEVERTEEETPEGEHTHGDTQTNTEDASEDTEQVGKGVSKMIWSMLMEMKMEVLVNGLMPQRFELEFRLRNMPAPAFAKHTCTLAGDQRICLCSCQGSSC